MKTQAWALIILFPIAGCATTPAPVAPAAVSAATPSPPRIDAEHVGIVLIDAQPAFWGTMHGDAEPVMQRIEQLLVFADITRCPLVATF